MTEGVCWEKCLKCNSPLSYMKNSTLCYIEQNGSYLMLHRVKKKNDCNEGKWIGIGGHFEEGESPFDCILRETKEETGLLLTECSYRGIVTFASPDYETEQMHLFHASRFVGELIDDCNEGTLAWIPKNQLDSLALWDGDQIFLSLLDQNVPFFSLKLVYDSAGTLLSHELLFSGETREPLLISACLLGTRCRYDGCSKPLEQTLIDALSKKYILIPVCGERLGGLSAPRPPSEIQADGSVVSKNGQDVTDAYRMGAAEILKYARLTNAKTALLKARSPSCGKGSIYDGTFSKTLVDGDGITTRLLKEHGIAVYTEEELDVLL